MAAGSVNLLMGCEDCRKADAWGRGCKEGLLFPVMVLMAGYDRCPNFEKKTLEQLQEQYELLNQNK